MHTYETEPVNQLTDECPRKLTHCFKKKTYVKFMYFNNKLSQKVYQIVTDSLLNTHFVTEKFLVISDVFQHPKNKFKNSICLTPTNLL